MTTEVMVPEQMSPESMKVIEAYLNCGNDIKAAARMLGMPEETVVAIYKRPEVRTYINTLFMESGFRNRDKFFGIMDHVLTLKMEELEESGMGSSADILDILKAMHSMKMKEMEMEIKLLTAQNAKPQVQNNTQVNVNLPGSDDPAYRTLMENLMKGKRR